MTPMYAGPALLLPGDGVATTRNTSPSTWEPVTFAGYVQSRPVRKVTNGFPFYEVQLDTGRVFYRNTQTLAIYPPDSCQVQTTKRERVMAYLVTVTIGPAGDNGRLHTEVKAINFADLADYATLLGTRGYGSPFHEQSGEYVAGVSFAVRADRDTSEQEALDDALMADGHVKRRPPTGVSEPPIRGVANIPRH